jgi:UDP-3-O-[3-hydroxymyristoyl] glucosamine N-acyltransferase
MPNLAELCRIAGGVLAGDGSVAITGVASVESAGPGDVAPVDSERFVDAARASRAGAFVAPEAIAAALAGRACIVTPHPLAVLTRIIETLGLVVPPPVPGIHPRAMVDPGAVLGAGAHVGPFAVIEAGARIGARAVILAGACVERGAVIGDDCWIEPGAVIHDGARLGHRVRVGANAVISRQGFGYAPGPAGIVRLHHVGTVVLEDDVHVGACTTIDRGRFDATRIGRMTKLDNLIQIGHNCTVGARTFIAAQSGLAGNARIGDDCQVGGQVGIANLCGVGNRARVAAKTGVIKMWGDDVEIAGYPGETRRDWQRMYAALRRLIRGSRISRQP